MGANSSYPDKRKNESFVEYCQRTHKCEENPPIEYCAHLARANKFPDGCKHHNARRREREQNNKGPPNKRSMSVKYRKDLPKTPPPFADINYVPKYLQLDTPRQEAPKGMRQPPACAQFVAASRNSGQSY